MTSKETLFFIGKCLTINHEEHNKVLVESILETDEINWDDVVKISTAHYVFPALYCNLKKADFLDYLPDDLAEYMQHITDLNRERNEQIITQAKELNELLLKNDITPIFLKGTGNLLEGLYDDIAERMVGDIDFLVAEKDCFKAFNLLQETGYVKIGELYDEHRHLPRLTHPKKIAAIELHREMLRKEKSVYFNFDSIKNSTITINNMHFLSFKNQIKLTIFSKFINDDAYQLKTISLRPAYDILCLSDKEDLNLDKNEYLSKELNAGLSVYTSILSIQQKVYATFDNNTIIYTKKAIASIGKNNKTSRSFLFLKHRIVIILKAFSKKSYLKFVLSKFLDRNWYKRRFGI